MSPKLWSTFRTSTLRPNAHTSLGPPDSWAVSWHLLCSCYVSDLFLLLATVKCCGTLYVPDMFMICSCSWLLYGVEAPDIILTCFWTVPSPSSWLLSHVVASLLGSANLSPRHREHKVGLNCLTWKSCDSFAYWRGVSLNRINPVHWQDMAFRKLSFEEDNYFRVIEYWFYY